MCGGVDVVERLPRTGDSAVKLSSAAIRASISLSRRSILAALLCSGVTSRALRRVSAVVIDSSETLSGRLPASIVSSIPSPS
jgi:hypothetical protein